MKAKGGASTESLTTGKVPKCAKDDTINSSITLDRNFLSSTGHRSVPEGNLQYATDGRIHGWAHVIVSVCACMCLCGRGNPTCDCHCVSRCVRVCVEGGGTPFLSERHQRYTCIPNCRGENSAKSHLSLP